MPLGTCFIRSRHSEVLQKSAGILQKGGNPMSRLHVESEKTGRATPGAIWALVSDATRYPEWGPWSAAGYQRPGDDSPHGRGAIHWLRSARRAYLRYQTSIEKILEAE